MNSGALGGLIGGIVGIVGGIAGGAIGTYFSIKNTNGPRERAFVIKASIVAWIAILAFLAGLLLLPSPYRYFLWGPYAILLPMGILTWNKKQAQIRREEAGKGADSTKERHG